MRRRRRPPRLAAPHSVRRAARATDRAAGAPGAPSRSGTRRSTATGAARWGASARTRSPASLELLGLVGVVREQVEPVDAEGQQHLRGDGVVALVDAEAEGQVGLEGVEPVVLQGVGVDLVVEPDPAPLLAEVEQVAAGLVDPGDRLVAAAGRSRSAGCRARPRSGTRCAAARGARRRSGRRSTARSPSATTTCSRPSHEAVEGVDMRADHLSPGEPQRQPDLSADGRGGHDDRASRAESA